MIRPAESKSIQAGEPVSEQTRPPIVVLAPGRSGAHWVIAVLLAVLATAVLLRWDEAVLLRAAWAQNPLPGAGPGAGARGIYAFTGQLDAKSYGLFMLDVDSGTVWCYEMSRNRSGDPIYMRLVAARNWLYDRYLEEFNVAPPTPTEVRRLVEQQRQARQAPGSQPGAVPPEAPAREPAEGPAHAPLKLPATP